MRYAGGALAYACAAGTAVAAERASNAASSERVAIATTKLT
jgi:hypothetical protein